MIRYPRPATVRERSSGAVDAGAEGSPCVFLAPGGCSLRFDDRPRMCRDLEPWANGECVAAWDLPMRPAHGAPGRVSSMTQYVVMPSLHGELRSTFEG